MYRKIKDYFRLFLYNLFLVIFFITPKFIMKKMLQFFAYFAYRFNKKHGFVARANLDLVYKDSITKEQKEQILYNSYKSLVYNMYEFFENQYISKEELFKKAKVVNGEVIQKALDEGRKIIYISAHYGGWELTVPYIALKYGKVAIVNRKMNNPHIQEKYEKARNRNNITMLEKESAARGMIKAFSENKAITVVIDQHIRSGIEVEFLSQKVLATDSTSRMALKFDALIIPIFTICNDFRDFSIEVGKPLDVREISFQSDDHIKELTQMQNDIISMQILQKPDFWLWQHRRFKKFHKSIYKKQS